MLTIDWQDREEGITSFYLNSIRCFITPAVLDHFLEVVLNLVSNGKSRPGDIVITADPPWLQVDENANLELVCISYAVYASRINWNGVENPVGEHLSPENVDLSWRRPALFEQRLWEIIVFCLIIQRGVSEGALQIFREHLNYSLGYLHGATIADDRGVKDSKRLESVETATQLLERARQAKLEKLKEEDAPFYTWASERLMAGDMPSTLDQVLALPGFKPEWSAKNEKSLRALFKRAGFVLKPGRPSKD